MCIIQGKTPSKHNGLTYRHKRNKDRIPLIFQQWKQKKDVSK